MHTEASSACLVRMEEPSNALRRCVDLVYVFKKANNLAFLIVLLGSKSS